MIILDHVQSEESDVPPGTPGVHRGYTRQLKTVCMCMNLISDIAKSMEVEAVIKIFLGDRYIS